MLATGARNRTLNTPGALYLRTLREGVALQERLQQASNVTVIGGSFIGLEVAAAARALGKTVAVYDTGPRVMARAVCPEVSQYFEQTHAAQGVAIHTNFSATPPPADLTLVGIGLGAYGLTQAMFQIPFGMASDAFGRKRVIVIGLILFAFGSAVAAMAPDATMPKLAVNTDPPVRPRKVRRLGCDRGKLQHSGMYFAAFLCRCMACSLKSER